MCCCTTPLAAVPRLTSSVGACSGHLENMSPESASSLFPDRPIRPLPKRRLRERLSPDVADSIKYPPAPQTAAPLFVYPYNSKDESTLIGTESPNAVGREGVARRGQDVSLRRGGFGIEHEDASLLSQARKALGSRFFHEPQGHATRASHRPGQARHVNPQPPPSTASSADGYDSFENTNNKKKRKIPTAGETVLNGSHVLHDTAAFGIPSPPNTADDGFADTSGVTTMPYYQAGGVTTNGQGISGPGRGRYGRIRNGRSPLRALSDSNGNWSGRNIKLRAGGQFPSSPPPENSGIISTAIASAERLPIPQGQENISLLQRQVSTKSSPASSTQFTFTFDSRNPVSWPGSDPTPTAMSARSRAPVEPQASQAQAGRSAGAVGAAPAGTQSIGNAPATATNTAPKKTKRRGHSLQQQAKSREKDTMWRNVHHPPAPEDIWICEFCEYEQIFGERPEALIRQYEIKDRRRRREEEERRRLLEKAKMKSRKGKKASKAPAKSSATATDHNAHDQHGPPPPPPPIDGAAEDLQSEGNGSEEHVAPNQAHQNGTASNARGGRTSVSA
ncbi:hypothetical protein GGR56DRAFT_666113 [Xylariaceae sp. FL0804]|nr:hypothetical protein GGR56DRAFT_666113 [Xylariaceae sp. FL0804]